MRQATDLQFSLGHIELDVPVTHAQLIMWDMELKEGGGYLSWRYTLGSQKMAESGADEVTWGANKMGRGLQI